MPSLAEVIRPELSSIADEIIEAIGREVADYDRPLKGEFGRNVRQGVEFALGRFLDEREGRGPGLSAGSREVYVALGRGEYEQGRSLDALLSAYRVGARVAWRRCVDAGKAAGVEPDVLYGLGEAMFAYIDGLSAESTEGYAEAQTAAAGERARAQRRLVALLLHPEPPEPAALQAAAERAGWPPPRTLAVLATEVGDAEALAARLGADVIAAEQDGATVALVPDPAAPGRRATLARALGGVPAALGPEVAPAAAAMSANRARLTLRLLGEGVLPGPLAAAEDHLAELIVHADRRLAADLAEAALAPLRALPERSRAKLEPTLRVWLDHQGRIEETAAVLGVHPQTVRYRLAQLRERFGTRLDEPEGRFGLALALRVR